VNQVADFTPPTLTDTPTTPPPQINFGNIGLVATPDVTVADTPTTLTVVTQVADFTPPPIKQPPPSNPVAPPTDTKQKNDEVISLFLHDNHYSLIKTYSRFCGGDKEYTCPNCMSSYANAKCYKTHLKFCKELNANGTRYIMPEKGTVTEFSDHKNKNVYLL